jgi:hypothetical protein
MFERYTEKARRVIFFARYEASQFGSPVIDTEHLLLGLLREDKSLHRWLPKMGFGAIRRKVEEHLTKLPPTSTAIDLPLSETAKHVLKHAFDETQRLANGHIGTEHLLLALIEEKRCFPAKLLQKAGADAAAIRIYYAERPEPPKPGSFQRFRTLSAGTVEIHGSRWNVDYVRDAINFCRTCNWHWRKSTWKPRDIVIHRKTGACSFDLSLVKDSANFELAQGGWKKDHCVVCRWELFESADVHGSGYTNGHDWLCVECYERFWRHPDFFSSSQSEMT